VVLILPWAAAQAVDTTAPTPAQAQTHAHQLLQTPAAELQGLRRLHRRGAELKLNGRRESTSLAAALSPAAEIVATFEPRDAGEFGLQVRVGCTKRR
jgi:hypothetical protein